MPFLLISAGIIILDRLTKILAYNGLEPGQSLRIIPGVFHITLVLNKGAAFGLFGGGGFFFIALSVFVLMLIIAYLWRENRWNDLKTSFILALLAGGAIGNMIDRVKFGWVIDFFDFRIWPVFNIADSAITIGAILLGWKFLMKKD